MPSVAPGIQGVPTATIPTDPQAFVTWFTSVFLPRWAANADVRNAVQGSGINITGTITTPATISVNSQVNALFQQPYVLLGSPVAPAPLTNYRSLAVQSGVLSLADGGAESSVTINVENNGIGNSQIRQGIANSVIGNSAATAGNVADIAATANGQVLQMSSGTLSFAALPAGSLASIANDTVLGNVTGASASPTALNTAQLTSLINVATASLTGALPVLSGTATQYLNGTGVWSTPPSVSAANPTAKVGLTAVNGSAATFMTSDSAPPIDQTITPTWTGTHTFNTATVSISAAGQINTSSSLSAGTRVSAMLSGDISCARSASTGAMYFGSNGTQYWYYDGTYMNLGVSGIKTPGPIGINGATPAAQVTGFGTPTGAAVVANFPGATATLVQCSETISELITILKACGILGA